MKKSLGILSLVLALTLAVNAVMPALRETVRQAFAQTPQAAAVNQTAGDSTASDGEKAPPAVSDQKEVAYDNGKILIYRFEQLAMIGSGKTLRYADGVSATYAPDADYKLARDIPVPRHTAWALPAGFTGTITGDRQAYTPLYDNASDSIYVYHPYQLATMAMDNAAQQTVLSGDAEVKTFGTGQPVCRDKGCKALLTYSGEHNYVISSQFSSDAAAKPVSVRSDKTAGEAVAAQADPSVGVPAAYDGRDRAGQVIKKIDGKTYILIGNEDQLRAIGTNANVMTPVYKLEYDAWTATYDIVTENGKPVLLYGGDADLEKNRTVMTILIFNRWYHIIPAPVLIRIRVNYTWD